jgi:hypothetical protein
VPAFVCCARRNAAFLYCCRGLFAGWKPGSRRGLAVWCSCCGCWCCSSGKSCGRNYPYPHRRRRGVQDLEFGLLVVHRFVMLRAKMTTTVRRRLAAKSESLAVPASGPRRLWVVLRCGVDCWAESFDERSSYLLGCILSYHSGLSTV